MKSSPSKKIRKVNLIAADALTIPQANALLGAAERIAMRYDLTDDDTITKRERALLEQAMEKLCNAINMTP